MKQASSHGNTGVTIRRLYIALVLSAIAHALIIWTPHLHLPVANTPIPELTVKLNPLPKKTIQPRKPPKPKPQTIAKPTEKIAPIVTSKPEPTAPPVSEPEKSLLSASAVPAFSAASAPVAASAVAATDAIIQPEKIPFPKHVLLVFAVYNGDNGFHLGEVQHTLDITDNRYIVQSRTRTTGIVRWFKSFNLNQTSTGTVSSQGLKPDNFAEEKYNNGDIQTLTAIFDWTNHQVNFSSGTSSPLPDDAQDALSVLYQLALTRLNREIVTFPLSTGKKLDEMQLEIANNQTISTAMGDLETVKLRRLAERGKSGLIIWLAKEFRMLPVKIQYLEPDGSISATVSVTEISYTED